MLVFCGTVFFPMLHLLLAELDLHSIMFNVKRVREREIRGSSLIRWETSTSAVGDSHSHNSNTDQKTDTLSSHNSPNHLSRAPHNSNQDRRLGGVDLRKKLIHFFEHSTCSIGGQNGWVPIISICIQMTTVQITNDLCTSKRACFGQMFPWLFHTFGQVLVCV